MRKLTVCDEYTSEQVTDTFVGINSSEVNPLILNDVNKRFSESLSAFVKFSVKGPSHVIF